MNEPAVAPPSNARTKLVITTAFFAVMFVLGSQFDPRQSGRVFAAAGAVTSIVAGIIPAMGSRRPRLQRWLLRVSMTAAAIMFGFLARMIVRGLHGG